MFTLFKHPKIALVSAFIFVGVAILLFLASLGWDSSYPHVLYYFGGFASHGLSWNLGQPSALNVLGSGLLVLALFLSHIVLAAIAGLAVAFILFWFMVFMNWFLNGKRAPAAAPALVVKEFAPRSTTTPTSPSAPAPPDKGVPIATA
jgi:hypothetical protein